LRVIAADGDLWMRLFYQELLPHLGHQVVAVCSGYHLAKLCSAVQPDLVLMDVRLPDADGLDIAEQLSSAWLAPVVLVSAKHTPDELARAAQAPCVLGFLNKPITERELAPAMLLAVRRFHQMRELRGLADEREREAARLRQVLEGHRTPEQAGQTFLPLNGSPSVS
jgi:response regulator NasT